MKARIVGTQMTDKIFTHFEPAPYSDEVFTRDNKKLFNNLPAPERHFVKKVIQTGDIKKAAIEARVIDAIDTAKTALSNRSLKDALLDHGITADYVAMNVKTLIEAKDVKSDGKGNTIDYINLNMRREGLKLALSMISLDVGSSKATHEAIELFKDVKLEDTHDDQAKSP